MDSLTIKYWSPHGRQEESKFKPSDTKIDLIMRAAKMIDLAELDNCTNLEVLDLSHNMLERIDLKPLSGCNSLRQVVLHDNHLEALDLWPFTDTQSLKEIDLAANPRLRQIDLTPVFLRCIVHLDASVVVNADHILRYLVTNEETSKRFLLVRPDGAPWTASPVVIWNSYRKMEQLGWRSIQKRILSVLSQITESSWFAAQRGLLEGLGLSELGGFDGNPRAILAKTDQQMTFDEVIDTIEETVVELLVKQIEDGGPTLFLDTDVIRKTRASKLIPRILESRKHEIEEIRIPVRGSRVFLRSLYLTHYGYRILSALGMGLRTDLEGFSKIRTCFEEIGFDLQTKRMRRIRHRYPADNSSGMKRHVFDTILRRLP